MAMTPQLSESEFAEFKNSQNKDLITFKTFEQNLTG